jgi:membrane protease YdiL (CAAX protease family)
METHPPPEPATTPPSSPDGKRDGASSPVATDASPSPTPADAGIWPFQALAAASCGYLLAGWLRSRADDLDGIAEIAMATLPHQLLMLGGVILVAASPTADFSGRLQLRLRRRLDPLLGAGAAIVQFPALLLVALIALTIDRWLGGHGGEPSILPMIQDATPGGLLLIAVAAVTLAPLAEELVFRRILFACCRRFLGFAPAMVLTAAIFAAFHLSLVQWAPLFLLGLALQAAVQLSGSVWPAVAMHAVHNALAIAILFVQAE